MAVPSLRNLQVFEIASRHPTLRAAADALCLTHGAVSRQIRLLESDLGVSLFIRTKQGMLLTPQGRRLQEAVGNALKLLSDATAKLSEDTAESSARIAVTVVPSFGTRWLLSRLPDFQAHHPDINVELISTMATLDLAEKNIQLGIRNGAGKWSNLVSELLAPEEQFPVAASKGIDGYDRLPRSVQELIDYPLLNPYDDWQRWFRRVGVTTRPPQTGKTFNDASQLLRAAEAGKGIALGRKWLVADALKSGALVRLPGPSISSARSYYLVRPNDRPIPPAAEFFANWLRKQIESG
jgi:LysR family glycine cleavage system transcriptional activator